MIHEIASLQLIEEREKWEVERQEKEKELVVLRYQLKEKDEDIKVLQKNVTSIKEDMDRLEISHHQAIKDLTAKHQQQVVIAHCKVCFTFGF